MRAALAMTTSVIGGSFREVPSGTGRSQDASLRYKHRPRRRRKRCRRRQPLRARAEPIGERRPNAPRARCRRPPCRYGRRAASSVSAPGMTSGPAPRPRPAARCGRARAARPASAREVAAGRPRSPATRQRPAPGVLSPYQPSRHSRATGAASGTPSLSQSSSATNSSASSDVGVERGEAANLRSARHGIEAGEQRLDRLDRQLAEAVPAAASNGAAERAERAPGPAGSAWKSQGVASSASRRARPAGAAARASARSAAHAIAEQRRAAHRRPRAAPPRRRRLEPPGDVLAQAEAALVRAGRAPIDQDRAEAARRQSERMRLRRSVEIQDIGAVDQRRHDQERRALGAGRS